MVLREVDQKGGDQAHENNTAIKNQDCQWLELQDINNFINMQRFAHLEEPYSFAMVA
jgi:hypothetical protein